MESLREGGGLYPSPPQSLVGQLEALVERTEDFTDSAYTSHEQRQAILGLCQVARQHAQQLAQAWGEAVRTGPLAGWPVGWRVGRLGCLPGCAPGPAGWVCSRTVLKP